MSNKVTSPSDNIRRVEVSSNKPNKTTSPSETTFRVPSPKN